MLDSAAVPFGINSPEGVRGIRLSLNFRSEVGLPKHSSSHRYKPHTENENSDEEATDDSFRSMRRASPDSSSASGRHPQRGIVSNTLLLWRLVFPAFSFADLAVLVTAGMTFVAQFAITKLPLQFGEITADLVSSNDGVTYSDAQKKRIVLGVWGAFTSVVSYVVLRALAALVLMLTGMHWRLKLTRRFHQLYLSGDQVAVAYRLRQYSCDNPDQRMSSDLGTYIKLCCGG